MHPRTRGNIEKAGLAEKLKAPGLLACEPLAYLTSLGLMRDAKAVVTDSGGMQEETTALGVPCITVRDNTERPITISEGTNTLIGADPSRIGPIVDDILHDRRQDRPQAGAVGRQGGGADRGGGGELLARAVRVWSGCGDGVLSLWPNVG